MEQLLLFFLAFSVPEAVDKLAGSSIALVRFLVISFAKFSTVFFALFTKFLRNRLVSLASIVSF